MVEGTEVSCTRDVPLVLILGLFELQFGGFERFDLQLRLSQFVLLAVQIAGEINTDSLVFLDVLVDFGFVRFSQTERENGMHE